jgi:hypothetical protein
LENARPTLADVRGRFRARLWSADTYMWGVENKLKERIIIY